MSEHRWVGDVHEREHERIGEQLRRMSRELAGLKLTPEERRAVQAAAVKMVADNAIADNRRRRAPLWQDRRAVATLAVQAIVAIVATLALLHSINPAWW